MSKECTIVKGTGIFLAVIGLASLAMVAIAWFFGPPSILASRTRRP